MATLGVDAWQQENFDDADDARAAELGVAFQNHRARLVFSGNINESLASWSQEGGEPILPALWDVCEGESVSQAHALFHDAGANVALTNTWGCSPEALKSQDVRVSCERVCAAAARSAFSCAPAYVFGFVGVEEATATGSLENESFELTHALLKTGAHGLLVSGAHTLQGAQDLLRGVQRANALCDVARPVVFAVPAQALSSGSKELVNFASSLRHSFPELVGFGVSGIETGRVSEHLQLLRSLRALGYETYAALTAQHYGEIELAQAAGMLASEGVELLRAEAGIPPAGTTVLAEALDI